MPGRGLVLPGLVPIDSGMVRSILAVSDGLLDTAATTCGFDPSRLFQDPENLSTVAHEALLAVAAMRRVRSEGEAWSAFGGLSAGFLTALHAAGSVDEATLFRLIHAINHGQTQAGAARRSGTTVAVMTQSTCHGQHLLERLRAEGHDPWLSVDLGAGAVAVAVPAVDPTSLLATLERLSAYVVDVVDRAEHCPQALPRRDELAALVAEADVCVPLGVVVSPLTGRPVEPAPAALREELVAQWFDTASLPLLVDGLCRVPGVAAIDVVSPPRSAYLNRSRTLIGGRMPYRALPLTA